MLLLAYQKEEDTSSADPGLQVQTKVNTENMNEPNWRLNAQYRNVNQYWGSIVG